MSTEQIAQVTAAMDTVTAAVDKIRLRSSDHEEFVVDVKVAKLSTTLKNLIDDKCVDSVVPLLNVTGKILSKVIEYCKKHSEAGAEENLKEWNDDFVKVDQGTLFDLILASNYLEVKGLLDVTCQCVADMMKGKTPEEIRTIFNIKNDFTPEEEEAVRRENQWAFE